MIFCAQFEQILVCCLALLHQLQTIEILNTLKPLYVVQVGEISVCQPRWLCGTE